MAFPVFTTKRLLLRQFRKEDQEKVFYGLSHPEVIKYYGVSYTSLKATKEQMNWYSNLEKSKTGIWWVIASQDDNQFYGAIGFYLLSKEHRKAEMGYWLLREFWGKGYVQESAEKVLEYAFDTLALHRIEAFVEVGNAASSKTLEHLNFNYEGRMQDSEIKNGKFISVDVFARLSNGGK